MRLIATIFTAIPLFLFAACSQAEQNDPGVTARAHAKLVTVAEGLEHPWSLMFLPDGEYLVTERRGRMWRIGADGAKTEITGVPPVYHEGQGGLLDVVPSPHFDETGQVYFSYAAGEEGKKNTEVARARLNLDTNSLEGVEVIFRAEPKVSRGSNHWGSRLLFGEEDRLYITLGERYHYMDEAQDPTNNLGTVARIESDGAIPEDNPFADGEQGHPTVYSYGHRNAQGIARHPGTGAVWIHEHGPKGGDEINILKPGANYGWPAVTYGIDYSGLPISDKTEAPGMEQPLVYWVPSIAPSGMAFYTGDKFPDWTGDLFIGALAGQHLRRVDLDGSKVVKQEKLLEDEVGRVRDVRDGPDGYLYILTDALDGQLIRLEPETAK